jgi:AraC family transcriptional regulator of adaptative response / DNA-3-methyladenine glycosylase II
MAEIALDAGFRSIRQFNHAMRTVTGRSPSDLRRARGKLCNSSRLGEFTMRLSYRPPYDWSALIEFLKARATPGVELVEDTVYRRTIESDGEAGVIAVSPDRDNMCLVVQIALPRYKGLFRVVERVRRMFDLGADPLQIASHLSRDRRLKRLFDERPGLRAPGAWDGFEIAVRAALGQRLTVVDSEAVAGELVRVFGRPVETSVDGLTHLFPGPEELAGADLGPLGIAPDSAALVNALARAVRAQRLTFEASRTLQRTVSRLKVIEGISEEMAHYIALRACGEPDAFPIDDGALNPPAEAWRPWRAYAAMHLCAAGGAL